MRRSLWLLPFLLAGAAVAQAPRPPIDKLKNLTDVSIPSPANNDVLTYESASSKWKNKPGSGSGTVTTFSAGTLSPIFTTNVTNPTTTPDLTFSLSNAGAHSFLGNNTGSSGAPSYVQPAFSDLSGNFTLAQSPSTTASKLIGRGDSGAGAFQEITLGTNLSITGTTLNATGGGGGNVSTSGTITTGQLAEWTDATHIRSDTQAQAKTAIGATTVGGNLISLTNPSAITFLKINADNSVSTESASTHRTSLGATTIGGNMFTLTNPSAITFPKFNADNSITAESAANHRTSIGGTTVGQNFFTLTNPSAISFVKINADNSLTAENASTFRGDISAAGSGAVGSSGLTMNTARLLGRTTAAAGAIEEITTGSTLSLSATTLGVATNGIADANLRQSAGLSVIGNTTSVTGNVGDITAGAANQVLRVNNGGSALSWGTVANGGIANGAVTLSKIQNATANSILLGSGATGSGSSYSEIALGSGLSMSGTTLNVTAGGGNVSNVGTPTDGQLSQWATANTIRGVTPTSPIISTGGGTPSITLDRAVDFNFLTNQSIAVNDALNNDVSIPIFLYHSTTGTPANGIGTGITLVAETSVSNQPMATMQAVWSDVTDATRTAYLDFLLVNNAAAAASKMRLFPSGGLSVNSTSDPGAGEINANTGFKVAGTRIAITNLKDLSTTAKLVGSSSTTSPLTEITLGTNLSMSGTTLNASGGGGSPGGSDTQVQYRVNSTTFGGISNATSDGTTLTLTSPKLVTSLLDTNGNKFFDLTATTSAVNYLTLANAATTANPSLTLTGTDSDIGLTVNLKGNGSSKFSVLGGNGATIQASTISTAGHQEVLYLGSNSTGTPTNGFGPVVIFQAEDSTTNNVELGGIGLNWTEVTHATRKSALNLANVNNGVFHYRMQIWPNSGVSLGDDADGMPDPGAGFLDVQSGYKINNTNIFPVTTANGGVPSGGTTSQVLQKNSNTNYDVGWTTLTGGGNVSNSGTPTTGQYARWTDATHIEGVATSTVKSDLSLNNVTNDAQTQAAIVPNTAPTAGQILVGNAGNTAYAKQTVSGSGATITLGSTGVVTISAIANGSLSNSAITIAGTSTSLGGTITQDTITGLSTTGLVKRTAANTLTTVTAPTGAVVGDSDTQTLSSKRIDPRTTTSATNNTTPTPDVSTTDEYIATGMTVNMVFGAPTGTPVQGTKLIIRIKDNGTVRTIGWNATYVPIGVTLPTTTAANKIIYVGCIYNATVPQWDVVAVASEA